MTRCGVVALFLASIAGCGAAHEGSDSGTNVPPGDGSSADDAQRLAPDAPDAPCLDADGDGHADARCGGDDCDDTRADLAPGLSICDGPSGFFACAPDGSVQRVTCGALYCHPADGLCHASACGDGVVEPGEQCDDANGAGCSGCVYPECWGAAWCTLPEAPYCAPVSGGVPGICTPGNPGGLPLGSPCTADADCASTFCSPLENLCSEVCTSAFAECGGAQPHVWCGWDALELNGPFVVGARLCEWECTSNAQCHGGTVCVLADTRTFVTTSDTIHVVAGACRPRTGSSAPGAACLGGNDCASGPCVETTCTQVCATDADCPAVLPHCVLRDLSASFPARALLPRPATWGEPYPRICAP